MLTETERIRYQKQTALEEISELGQEKLAAARVLVIGAGGLGSPVLYYLAAAGIGTIGIVDRDRVEMSNLNRQILFTEGDIGSPKAGAAAGRISSLNSSIQIRQHPVNIDHANAGELVARYDVIVACVDNTSARYIINDACQQHHKPMIDAGVRGFDGYVMTILPGRGGCYRCLNPEIGQPGSQPDKAAILPVLGSTAGVAGSLQAAETIKVILGSGDLLAGYLLSFNTAAMEFEKIKLARNPRCTFCQP